MLNRLCLSLILVAAIPLPQAWAQEKVDLELILMCDGSGSIDGAEFRLQRGGYAKALRDPQVLSAIQNGFLGRIALTYVEWSGPYLQVPIVPWMAIRDAADINAFAARLERVPRQLYGGGTAPGSAILYAAQSLLTNDFEGKRLVIDISGDGPDTSGVASPFARDQAVAQGVVINGLPILNDVPNLDVFFRNQVIGGQGAFLVVAKDFDDIHDAVRMKLLREIASVAPDDATPAAELASR